MGDTAYNRELNRKVAEFLHISPEDIQSRHTAKRRIH
jgi:hypothetical protein